MKKSSLLILLPFLIWIFLFSDFLFGSIAVNIDTNSNYALMKFYINNIRNGVFPLWDPFLYAGGPFVFTATGGILNPFVYLIALLTFLGVDYYHAYLIYLVGYYFLGIVGFYFLAKTLLQNEKTALAAYLLLLFSGLGTALFNQVNMILIFVPAVWFFYFLIQFAKYFKKGDFLGLTFSVALILTSYMPFYFVTLFLVFALAFCLMCGAAAKNFIAGFTVFFKKNKLTVALGAVAVGVALVPLILFKILSASGEVVNPSRHCNLVSGEECYQKTMENNAQMSYQEACSGQLGWRVSFRHLFSHLDKINYAQDGWLYIPIFAYLVAFVALFTFLDKRSLLLLFVGLAVLFVALGEATPMHQLLFNHVFYFRYFRNLYFFMAFLIPIFILFAALQLQAILEHKITSIKQQYKILALIWLLHGIFCLFLLKQGNTGAASFVTVFASVLLFTLYFAGYLKNNQWLFFISLLAVSIIQPIEVFNAYSRNASSFRCALPNNHVYPKLYFRRPSEKLKTDYPVYRYVSEYAEFWHDILMQDSTGSVGIPGSAVRGAFALYFQLGSQIFTDYVKNKFITYDHVRLLGDTPEDMRRLNTVLNENGNTAFVSKDDAGKLSDFGDIELAGNTKAQIVTERSGNIQIVKFDVNALTFLTNFETKKFLVYTDGFNSHWKASINNRPSKIYRANIGFKGLWLPAGKNTVELVYSPPGGGSVYIFTIAFFGAFFAYMLFTLYREHSKTTLQT